MNTTDRVEALDLQILAEELWDKHSEYIEDDLFNLERVAGRNMMFEHDFKKAIQSIPKSTTPTIQLEEGELENELFLKGEDWCMKQKILNGDNAILSPELAYMEGYKAAYQQRSSERVFSLKEAYEIWKAGQKYWETSGASITFEELTEKMHPELSKELNKKVE